MASLPLNFLLNNQAGTKSPVVIVTIAGVDDIFTSQTAIFNQPRYGDPGLYYGKPGLTYGLNRQSGSGSTIGTIRDYLILEQSSIAINQKIEPEQGKGSTTLITLAFIDKDSYMTKLCSPGIVIPDILGAEINVYLGYISTAWPDDYFRIFRGYVSGVTYAAGMINLQTSDPGFKKQQNIFVSTTTVLTNDINSSVTTIPVDSTDGFYTPILNVLNEYDPAIQCFIQIDDEYMTYDASGISPTSFTVTRNENWPIPTPPSPVTPSVSEPHTAGTTVSNLIVIQDDTISMALKIMLSGWDGNWIDSVPCSAFNQMPDPAVGTIAGAILLPVNTDAIRDYGLSEGDLITVSGDTNNGLIGFITGFSDIFGQTNRAIVTDGIFTTQTSTTSTLAFRSQFDAYPAEASLMMSPKDVDVAQHLYIKNNFLLQSYYAYQFGISDTTDGKSFIETEIYFPSGAYSCTRQGRSSIVYTKPPFGTTSVVVLDASNVLKPETISPFRSVNQRRFFNSIVYSYDYDATQEFDTVQAFLDTNSLNTIGKLSELPINSQGLRTSLGAGTLVATTGVQLLNLYKNSALQITVMVTYGAAVQIEIGDPIILNDNGTLQIANFQTGVRDLGSQVFTVIERVLDIRQGNGKLTLMSGSGFLPTDRFASIAPSSLLGAGTTSTSLVITDSFNTAHPHQEYLKWQSYLGLRIWVHSTDYSISDTGGTLLGFSPTNNYILNVSGFSIVPMAGQVLELAPYSTSTSKSDQATAKNAHAFLDPTVSVTGGSSPTVFSVGSGDISKFQVGLPIIVHDSSWTPATTSPECLVLSASGTTVTVATSLGFTPSSGQFVDLIGFADGGQPYRFV